MSLKIKLVAVGTRMPKWVSDGYEEYAKRLNADVRLELIEIPLGFRGKNPDLKQALAQESSKIREVIPANDYVIALEVTGKPWSTTDLAEQLRSWKMQGQTVALLVGGPDGLPNDCVALAQQKWSLSKLTLPHPLVRVILAEQLYRAWSITQNHPYHR